MYLSSLDSSQVDEFNKQKNIIFLNFIIKEVFSRPSMKWKIRHFIRTFSHDFIQEGSIMLPHICPKLGEKNTFPVPIVYPYQETSHVTRFWPMSRKDFHSSPIPSVRILWRRELLSEYKFVSMEWITGWKSEQIKNQSKSKNFS